MEKVGIIGILVYPKINFFIIMHFKLLLQIEEFDVTTYTWSTNTGLKTFITFKNIFIIEVHWNRIYPDGVKIHIKQKN